MFLPLPQCTASVSLARIQRKSNDRLHDRFCLPDNRLVAELIYTCTGRKSGIWFTAKIPSDKGAAGERVQPGRDDKFIRLQCSCTTTPLLPHFLPPTVFFSRVIYVFRNVEWSWSWESRQYLRGWDLVSIDLEQFFERGFRFRELFIWYFCVNVLLLQGMRSLFCVRISDNLTSGWRNLIYLTWYPRRSHPRNDIYRIYSRLYIFAHTLLDTTIFVISLFIKTYYCPQAPVQRVDSKLSYTLLHVIERSIHSWCHLSTKMHRLKLEQSDTVESGNSGASLSIAKRHHFSPLHRASFYDSRNVAPVLGALHHLSLSFSAKQNSPNKIARLVVRKVKIHYIY